MSASSGSPHPMALAMEWVARITAIGIEMVLPGIAGQWLDQRIGTSFIGLVGFVVGVSGGIWHLLKMTQSPKTEAGPSKQSNTEQGSSGQASRRDTSGRESHGEDRD